MTTSSLRKVALQGGAVLLILMLGAGAGHFAAEIWQARQATPIVQSFDQRLLGPLNQNIPILLGQRECPACGAAKRWLDEHRVEHQVLWVEEDEQARELAQRLGIRVVPTLLIGNERITGFHIEELEKRLLPPRAG